MPGIETIAAVLQLAQQAAKTARGLHELCSIIDNAPQEIATISHDVNAFYVLVGNLERSLSIGIIATVVSRDNVITGALETLKDPIENCCKTFIKISKELQPHRRQSSLQRINWYLKRREVLGLATELERTKTTFAGAMGSVTLLIMLKIAGDSAGPIDYNPELNSDVGSALSEYAESVIDVQTESASLIEPDNTMDTASFSMSQLPSESSESQSATTSIERGKDGWSPLHSTASNGHIEVVNILLEAGADVNAVTDRGWTPLIASCNNGHAEVVKALLKAGVDFQQPDVSQWTALHFAASHGHLEIVKILLDAGADATALTDRKWTTLIAPCNNGHVEVVKALIEAGADYQHPTICDWTALQGAANRGQEAVVRQLLTIGDINVNTVNDLGHTPLSNAAEHGHAGIVKLLLDTGKATVDLRRNETPFYWAARSGHEAVVSLLLATGKVNVDYRSGWNESPLWWAARHGRLFSK